MYCYELRRCIRTMENTSRKMRKSNGRKRKGNRSIRMKIVLFFGVGFLLTLLLLYLIFSIYYQDHFYSNTVINGISTSDMSVDEAEDIIETQVKAYHLTITGRNGVTDTINGEDIYLHTAFVRYIPDLIEEQNGLTWPVSLFQSYEFKTNTILEYEDSFLRKIIRNLNCLDVVNLVEPENASISEYGEKGYEIIPDNLGAKVNKNKLYEAIRRSIFFLETSLSLEEAGCYEVPEISSEDPELLSAIDEINRIVGSKITYEFGEATEILDGDQISKWLNVESDFSVHFDTTGIKEFVDYIGKTYNSFGKVRDFQTSYGKVLKIKGGDYGWWLDRPKEVTELTDLIQNGEQLIKTPTYMQTAQQYGEDDIGNTYVELNLTAQHLFFYKEGKLILESDFVSGNISKELGTPVGTYPIQYKDNNATLVGEDYATPVKYWMPFNKNIGFHDASWRDEFGKDFYLTKGSHGCINMPPAAAKKMYENIQRGVAVVVYELPGTEGYDLEEGKDKDKDKDINKDKDKVDLWIIVHNIPYTGTL